MSSPNVLVGDPWTNTWNTYYLYILASKKNGTLYVGVTSNLLKRIYEHKTKIIEGFTKEYSVDKLIYFEVTHDVEAAINREKQIKSWNRAWEDSIN